jgi:hypothetical protein
MTTTPRQAFTPRQIRTLNDLLAIGAPRPYSPVDLADRLEAFILEGTGEALARWTEKSLWLTKSTMFTALRCEGQLIADASTPRTALHPATVVGVVAHRAIQLMFTHPGRSVGDNVREALIGAREADAKITRWWDEASIATQSDVLSQAASRVTTFADDWPPLEQTWSPRFEEPISARVGRLTLSSRADLVLGRPRADLRQTLLLVDLKSGNLNDEHEQEAQFYALVATLRHRVAPWRSLVYSLASGDYTQPDVTEETLFTIAGQVVLAVNNMVDALTEARPAQLNPGDSCRWCPASATCSVSAFRPETTDVTLHALTTS